MTKNITHVAGKKTRITSVWNKELEKDDKIKSMKWEMDRDSGKMVGDAVANGKTTKVTVTGGEVMNQYKLTGTGESEAGVLLRVAYWINVVMDPKESGQSNKPMATNPEVAVESV